MIGLSIRQPNFKYINNQENFNKEERRQRYRKEVEKAKQFFFKKKNFLLIVLVFIILIFLASKYNNELQRDVNEKVDNVVRQDLVEEDNVPEETEAEKNEKRRIVSEALGGQQINFAGQDLKLKGFFNPEKGVMSVYYANDVLEPKNEIAIYQYQEKISPSELFKKESIYLVDIASDAIYLTSESYNEDNYIIALSDFYNDFSSASLYLIKIFEKDGNTYKIVYRKNIKDDAVNKSQKWVNGDYNGLVDKLTDIDLSHAQKVFNDSLKIKNDLSKNNIYKDIKWGTKTFKEDNAYARINLEYPEFKGFIFANDLNKIIKDIIFDTLENDRKFIEEWKLDERNTFINDEGVVISDCYGDQDYFYSCSVDLHSSFEVKSIINNIISIELILTDYTGGGNGNHSYVKSIIYDLKNGKQLFLDNLFCSNNYLNRIKDILKANIITGPVFDNSLNELTDEVLLSHLRESSFNDLGLTLTFNPYVFTSGAYGIYNIFIPYSLLEDNICFNGYENNEILIKRSLLNLYVPVGLSDSCGFMADNCEDFRFYEGKFNDRDNASISVLFNDYKTGILLNNGKRENIVVVPYFWLRASTGQNFSLYVLKINDNDLTLLSRIDVGNNSPENLRIENNKIYFNSTNPDGSDNSKECYFENNIIEEKNLICR
ncbi:MAG TPA: DUF3298 domain-containing protein [bacterium]|nr:DUF3298 domain-containing protein [bacterium]